jgi:hypothetical protein
MKLSGYEPPSHVRPTKWLGAMPRWAIFLVLIYAIASLVTLGFQTYVRAGVCSGYRACAVSFTKGAVWSAIWPASWPVYVAGLKR